MGAAGEVLEYHGPVAFVRTRISWFLEVIESFIETWVDGVGLAIDVEKFCQSKAEVQSKMTAHDVFLQGVLN